VVLLLITLIKQKLNLFMNRIVPHQNLYNDAKTLDKWQTVTLSLAALFTTSSIVLNILKEDHCSLKGNICLDIVDGVASLLAVIYLVFEILVSSKLYKAEKARRTDLIDHSFSTNFAGQQSSGYYNPGGITPGVYKMAVNGFENSLFSSNTAKKMTTMKWLAASVVLLIFLLSAFMGEKLILNSLIQIAAVGVLVQQAIRLQLFSDRINKIHEDFKILFSNMRDETDKTKREGEMVKNVLNYETTISSAGIILDSTIFLKHNDELSRSWEKMKQDYKFEYVNHRR
jgi:hypothetical protein